MRLLYTYTCKYKLRTPSPCISLAFSSSSPFYFSSSSLSSFSQSSWSLSFWSSCLSLCSSPSFWGRTWWRRRCFGCGGGIPLFWGSIAKLSTAQRRVPTRIPRSSYEVWHAHVAPLHLPPQMKTGLFHRKPPQSTFHAPSRVSISRTSAQLSWWRSVFVLAEETRVIYHCAGYVLAGRANSLPPQ